jgi:chromosome partitioning protein
MRKSDDKITAAQLDKFMLSLEAQQDEQLIGCMAANAGFTKAAITQVMRDAPERLVLLTEHKQRVVSAYPFAQVGDASVVPTTAPAYVGVFTAKGGVGKTTMAAHLAGAFALMGQSVVLLDLDPDQNLRKLFAIEGETDLAELHVPAVNKNEAGAMIRVLKPEQWRESQYPDVRVVIADCSPVLSENPIKLMKRLDVCLMPTSLNPLGISKHGDVIQRTFGHIRSINQTARLLAVINQFDASKEFQKRNDVLFAYLQSSLQDYLDQDQRASLIHPDEAKIRYSHALLYWGFHIIEGSAPQLAFKLLGGRSYPRSDFLQLADVVEQVLQVSHPS